MGKLRSATSFGLGAQKSADGGVFSANHFVSSVPPPPEVKAKIASLGLVRAAGNAYFCPSEKNFWLVKGRKIVRLTGDEVDNGESIQAANETDPQGFLAGVMDDISW
jgi:hypothetical protein